MKKLILTSILALLVAAGATAIPQEYPEEYLGLPGDNLNLYAVMKIFQESETLEGFERSLNDENSRINNLDLNGDNLIDYITVQDYVDGNVHTIVLRTALNRNEFQDVAVFTVQKFRDGSVQIQLVGDEQLYGSNYIIEPIYDETPNPGYTGNASRRATVTVVRTTPYEVAVWPVIRYIYMPNYVIWRSSWYWGYYPSYWSPWRPYYWHYYYGYHYNWYHHYYNHYRIWHVHRYPRYNDFYYRSVRAHSPYVSQRIREGQYRNTYSRPEQRREGEAYFSKAHPSQTRRTADNTPAVQQRRPMPQNGSQQNATGTARRQAESNNQRSAVKSSAEQNTGTTRRSGTTVNDRPAGRSTPAQNQGTERRSTTIDDRPVNRSTPAQNQGTERRSTTVDDRPVNRSTPAQNQGTQKRSTTVDDRPVNRSTPAQNQGTQKRSTTTVNDRPASRSSSVQNSGTTRKPAATVTQRSAPRPSTNVRTQSSSSRQPATRSRSTETRSSRSSTPAQSSKRSSEKKESSGSSRTRR